MLEIYANAMMAATRTGRIKMHEVPPPRAAKPRWWHTRKALHIDPGQL